MNPIAVTLLTGFLDVGKTTLLRHIPDEQHGYKIVVVENESGEVSVDDQLADDRTAQIRMPTSGRICCSRSNKLEDALLNLLDNLDEGSIQFDRLVIEYTGMADPGPIIQTFLSHEVLCRRYPPDGMIASVDAVHADEQTNQFAIAQPQVGYANCILLAKTSVIDEAEKLRERLARINVYAPAYIVTHGDISLGLLLNINNSMLGEDAVSTKPCSHFTADKQNDISSIVVELDYLVDINEAPRVMENLLLESADKPLRYKGILWTDGEPNRLLLQGVQRLYSADWGHLWGGEKPRSTTVLIGIQLPKDEIRVAPAGLKK